MSNPKVMAYRRENGRVGIRNHEFHAFQLFFDHVVDGIAAGPAHTKYGDPGFQVLMAWHCQIQSHFVSACFVMPARAG